MSKGTQKRPIFIQNKGSLAFEIFLIHAQVRSIRSFFRIKFIVEYVWNF